MRKFWIDTDTASDDAVAILMALRTSDVDVLGISVVAGNVPAEQGSKNARYTTELCGKKTPVYMGAIHPLLREPQWAYFFHGEDGMGNMNYPEASLPLQKENGVFAFIEAVRANPGEITLVTLGPLTNIALALRLAPDIAEKISMCYVMGGAAVTLGNVSPAAEYNIYIDPEAAKIVFHSGIPILMVGWEHCMGDANLSADEMKQMRAFKTPYADFTLDCNATAIETNKKWLSEPGLALPDPVTMAVALEPDICTERGSYYVDVETSGEATRGMTVVDKLGVTNKPANIEVCWKIDIQRWKDLLFEKIK